MRPAPEATPEQIAALQAAHAALTSNKNTTAAPVESIPYKYVNKEGLLITVDVPTDSTGLDLQSEAGLSEYFNRIGESFKNKMSEMGNPTLKWTDIAATTPLEKIGAIITASNMGIQNVEGMSPAMRDAMSSALGDNGAAALAQYFGRNAATDAAHQWAQENNKTYPRFEVPAITQKALQDHLAANPNSNFFSGFDNAGSISTNIKNHNFVGVSSGGGGFASIMMGMAGNITKDVLGDLGIGGWVGDRIVQGADEAQEHPLQLLITAGSLGWGMASSAASAANATTPAAYDVGGAAAAEGGLGIYGAGGTSVATDPLALGLSESTALNAATSSAIGTTGFEGLGLATGGSLSELAPALPTVIGSAAADAGATAGTGLLDLSVPASTATTGFETASLATTGADNILASTVFDTAAVDAALSSGLTGAAISNIGSATPLVPSAADAASIGAGSFTDLAAASDILAPEIVAQDILLEPGLGTLAGGVMPSAAQDAVISNIAATGIAPTVPDMIPITDQAVISAGAGAGAGVGAAAGTGATDVLGGAALGAGVVGGGSVVDDILNDTTVEDLVGPSGDGGGIFGGDWWSDFWGSSDDGTGLSGFLGGLVGSQNDTLTSLLGQLAGGAIDQDQAERQEQLVRDLYGQAVQASDPFAQYRSGYANRLNTLYDDPSSVANLPNYQFMMDQGTQAINRSAAAKGNRLGGNVLYELQKYGQGLASQVRQEELSNLITLSGANVNPGNAAAPLMNMANTLTGIDSSSNAAWGNRLRNILGGN